MPCRAFLGAVVLVLAALPGCGRDATDPDPPRPAPETAPAPEVAIEVEGLRGKELWLALIPPVEPVRGTQTAVVRLGPGGAVEPREHLRGIRLPERPSKQAVRTYVGRVLRAASRKGMFGARDPEVEMLVRVGREHVDVLIEPLVHLGHFNGSIYVVEALKALVTDDDEDRVLEHLAAAPELVQVVVSQGWTEDAAPILFEALARRDPYLDVDWVEAAAPFASPEHYDDLRFQLAHGGNRHHVWKAIRHLPGIEPLEPTILRAWRATSRERDPYEWGQLATIAAHYGHVEGLAFLVDELADGDLEAWWDFRALTGRGADRESWPTPGQMQEARRWFDANRDRLRFDRDRGRYVVE